MDGTLNRRELTLKALAGFLGGALGWVPVEIASHGHTLTEAQTTASVVANFATMALLSGVLGGTVLAADAQTFALTARVKRLFVRGFLICLVLSLPAIYYSNVVFSKILIAGGWAVDHPGSMLYLTVARVVSWTMLGTMLGAGVGLAAFSLQNVVKGAIGGWVGGFIGGFAFHVIDEQLGAGGMPSRLVGLCAVGLCIGLFIGLVQELTKSAWLTVEAGRLRGRGFRLDQKLATIGRAEENPVGLFGDPTVQQRHAVIENQSGRYVLKNIAVEAGTFVNGRRIESAELSDGDRIRLGGYELSFHLRHVPAAAPAAGAPVPAAVRSAPAQPPAAAATGPCLADQEGRRFPLRQDGATRLGRALDNDIVIADASVSRHHAEIVATNGAFEVRDLKSHNGTYVGERRISEAHLEDGVLLKLGYAAFTFHA